MLTTLESLRFFFVPKIYTYFKHQIKSKEELLVFLPILKKLSLFSKTHAFELKLIKSIVMNNKRIFPRRRENFHILCVRSSFFRFAWDARHILSSATSTFSSQPLDDT